MRIRRGGCRIKVLHLDVDCLFDPISSCWGRYLCPLGGAAGHTVDPPATQRPRLGTSISQQSRSNILRALSAPFTPEVSPSNT